MSTCHISTFRCTCTWISQGGALPGSGLIKVVSEIVIQQDLHKLSSETMVYTANILQCKRWNPVAGGGSKCQWVSASWTKQPIKTYPSQKWTLAYKSIFHPQIPYRRSSKCGLELHFMGGQWKRAQQKTNQANPRPLGRCLRGEWLSCERLMKKMKMGKNRMKYDLPNRGG
jgi:hypothetical protein